MEVEARANARLLILTSLASGPKHGYAMVNDIASFSGTHLGPGTLYAAIQRLEADGLIQPLPSDERRRPYRITLAGTAVLRTDARAIRRVAAVAMRRLAPQ